MVFEKRFLETRFENWFLRSGFWEASRKSVFGKRVLENAFWELVSENSFVNRFLRSDFGTFIGGD